MKTAAIAAHSATKLGRKIARTLIFMVILASYKVEYGQLHEMAPAFGVRLLGTALVVISVFYRFPRQRTRVDFLSDHCRRIEVDYQSGSKQPHSKGCRHFKQLIIFSFNLQTLQLFWYLIDT